MVTCVKIFGVFLALLLVAATDSVPMQAAEPPEAGRAEPAGQASEEEGPARFVAAKCNLCHGVPAFDIAAKTKSEKLLGPEIIDLREDFEPAQLAAYLRQQAEQDGDKHKREFKGSDEELAALIDWLLTLQAADPEGGR